MTKIKDVVAALSKLDQESDVQMFSDGMSERGKDGYVIRFALELPAEFVNDDRIREWL